MAKPHNDFYAFGPFQLDIAERLLWREGVRVPLTDKAFDMLIALIGRGGRLATKEELLSEVWPDTIVEENNLDKSISAIRQALGDKSTAPLYVETVRGRGYRFIAQVSTAPEPNIKLASESLKRTEDNQSSTLNEFTVHHRKVWIGKSRALMLGVLLLAVGMGTAAYLWRVQRRKQIESASTPKTLAVLPFKPIASGQRDESLEVGIADTLITKLGVLRAVTVRPISAVRKYTSLDQDPLTAGREMGVDAVLEGSIQRAGDRVRITVRLRRVPDGASLWTGTFDEKVTDIFTVQDAITDKVTRSISARLSSEEQQQLAKRYTNSVEAYQLYLKGRYFWNKRTEEATKKSIDYFQQAVAVDSNYALAYSGLADAYWTLHFLGDAGEVEQLPAQAQAMALRALALDDTLAEAHTSLGEIKEVFELNFPVAEKEYRRALELNFNYAPAHQRYGFFLNRMGRIDEAREEFKQALLLDPLSPVINTEAARPFIRSRDYASAIEQLKKAIEIDPNFPRAHNLMAVCYTQTGRYEDAIAEAQKAAALSASSQHSTGSPPLSYQLAYIYARAGNVRQAHHVLTELEKSPSQRNDQAYMHTLAYVALGDRERAFALMERLYETHNIDLLALKNDPALDELRGDARFQSLLRRFGLT